MVRPIDADALKRKLQKTGIDAWKKQITASVETTLNEVIDIVDALPTVEPQEVTAMDDLISRAEAISAINGWDWQDLYLPIHFKQVLEELPTVNHVRHGKWMGTVCTACGTSEPYYYDFEYCPHCGAKMDG